MLTRCFFCTSTLPRNEVVEHFPVAERIAYDPGRGRLWAVCPRCGRWLLAPFDARWEALEEIRRLVHDRGRLLARTDNVALVEVGPVEIVHVGRVDLREEAWWRYGADLAERVRRANAIALRGKIIDAGIMMLLMGIPWWGWRGSETWIDRARRRAFGRTAWEERLACSRCGRRLGAVRFADGAHIRLLASDTGIELRRVCRRCKDTNAGAALSGPAGEHLLRRLLAYQNFSGGPEDQLDSAAAAIREAGSPEAFIRRVASGVPRLGRLRTELALGLEIAANEGRERALLDGEVSALEERWREEERIADIADGELTP